MLRHGLVGSQVQGGDDRPGAVGGGQGQRLPAPRGEAQGGVLELRLGRGEGHRELAEHLGVGVQRVAGLSPRLVIESRPRGGHGGDATSGVPAATLTARTVRVLR